MQKGQGSSEKAPELPGGLGSELRVRSFFRFSPLFFFVVTQIVDFGDPTYFLWDNFPPRCFSAPHRLGPRAGVNSGTEGGLHFFSFFFFFFFFFLGFMGSTSWAPPKKFWQTLFKVEACLLIAPDEVCESCD